MFLNSGRYWGCNCMYLNSFMMQITLIYLFMASYTEEMTSCDQVWCSLCILNTYLVLFFYFMQNSSSLFIGKNTIASLKRFLDNACIIAVSGVKLRYMYWQGITTVHLIIAILIYRTVSYGLILLKSYIWNVEANFCCLM